MKMKEPKDEIRSRRRPKVNVLLVAAALLVPFTLFMWRIFGTKETPQQEGAAGINFSVPEGREQQIESSKQKVVAKVRTEALQAQRLLTLGEESFSLLDDRTEQPPSRQNPMQEADEANRALQRQLAQTYAPRTSEREVEHLRRKVEELSARLDASPPAASADPLELAERQYQLAQKYLGGGTPHIDTVPAERRRLCVLRPVPERALTASTLGAAANSARERNAGFLTAEGEKGPEHNTAVSACIAQTQTVRSGEMVRLRLLEEAAVDGVRLPRGTSLYGEASLDGVRLRIVVRSIRYQGRIFPLEAAAYDLDGQPGLNIPESRERRASTSAATPGSRCLQTSPARLCALRRGMRPRSSKRSRSHLKPTTGSIYYRKNKTVMNRLSSLFLTIAALLAALAADAQHVDVAPRRIEVGFNKTVHILFPSPVTYIDIGSMDIIAGKAAGAENVVRVKAAVRDFPKETNLTVITEDGGYYSFDARYAENPQVATHEIGAATSASPAVQTPPAEGRVLLEATGRERPAVVKKTLNDIYRLNRTEMRLRKKHYGIETEVQGIYVRNDVIYIHLSLYNNSNISFEVEDLHFRIEDRKVAKRTAQQITPLELLRVCNDLRIVRAHQRQRTVFALPKFTMPDDKILVLEIVERNGARHQRIEIRNKQIRLARTL